MYRGREINSLLMANLTHFFYIFIYYISLHVSSITVLIIRRSNCINTSSGMISLHVLLYQMAALFLYNLVLMFLYLYICFACLATQNFIFRGPCISLQFCANDQLDVLFISLFIIPLFMFRASQCSSSGDRIVLTHSLPAI